MSASLAHAWKLMNDADVSVGSDRALRRSSLMHPPTPPAMQSVYPSYAMAPRDPLSTGLAEGGMPDWLPEEASEPYRFDDYHRSVSVMPFGERVEIHFETVLGPARAAAMDAALVVPQISSVDAWSWQATAEDEVRSHGAFKSCMDEDTPGSCDYHGARPPIMLEPVAAKLEPDGAERARATHAPRPHTREGLTSGATPAAHVKTRCVDRKTKPVKQEGPEELQSSHDASPPHHTVLSSTQRADECALQADRPSSDRALAVKSEVKQDEGKVAVKPVPRVCFRCCVLGTGSCSCNGSIQRTAHSFSRKITLNNVPVDDSSLRRLLQHAPRNTPKKPNKQPTSSGTVGSKAAAKSEVNDDVARILLKYVAKHGTSGLTQKDRDIVDLFRCRASDEHTRSIMFIDRKPSTSKKEA